VRHLLYALLLATGLVAGCGGGEAARHDLGAENCWGTGAASCGQAALLGRIAPLGLANLGTASVLTAVADCGAVVDCADAPPPRRTPAAATSSGGSSGSSVASSSSGSGSGSGSGGGGGSSSATPAPTATPVDAPTSATTPPPDTSGDDVCGGIVVKSLEGSSSLSPAETVCLQATAEGRTSATDPDVQVAAITLFNNRAGGWKGAVEAALKRPALGNAPPLNFAGIKPAYDQGRYSTVLKRSRTVWRNLDKGYQLSGKDRGFVVEFACRSAGQLALSGNPPDDGLDWCERWLDVAQRSGGAVGPIEDLISQLE